MLRIFKAECPNCQMKKEQVTEFYQLIMPNENAESFVEEIFQNFDKDSNGFLDFQVLRVKDVDDGGQFVFQEFLKLTDFAESGSVKDKLVWAFRIYDKDRSGEDRQGRPGGLSVLTRKISIRIHLCQGDGGDARDCLHPGGLQQVRGS